jgi:hypothetical protein
MAGEHPHHQAHPQVPAAWPEVVWPRAPVASQWHSSAAGRSSDRRKPGKGVARTASDGEGAEVLGLGRKRGGAVGRGGDRASACSRGVCALRAHGRARERGKEERVRELGAQAWLNEGKAVVGGCMRVAGGGRTEQQQCSARLLNRTSGETTQERKRARANRMKER